MSYRAWLLDLDGTLYHGGLVRLAMAAELALGGWSSLSMLRAFRSEHERLRQQLIRRVDNPFDLQLTRAARKLGIDAETLERRVRDWMFRRPAKWIRRFRRRALLEEIRSFRSAGGRTAVVSDYPATEKLEALGVQTIFEAVVASGEDGGPGRLKPWPDGYLLAAERLGVEPGACLVIGDRADADGEAARRAGMAFRRVG